MNDEQYMHEINRLEGERDYWRTKATEQATLRWHAEQLAIGAQERWKELESERDQFAAWHEQATTELRKQEEENAVLRAENAELRTRCERLERLYRAERERSMDEAIAERQLRHGFQWTDKRHCEFIDTWEAETERLAKGDDQ